MKKPSVAETVFQTLSPSSKQNGAPTWTQHVQRNLVPEVREEVQRYFGRIDCVEAQYPGLDYTFAPHRRRLAGFQWHRRLFRAFDSLNLTRDEILSLCNWEGTKAAKDRFEREQQTVITSTTLDGVDSEPACGGPRGILHDWNDSSQSTPQRAHTPASTPANNYEGVDASDEEDIDDRAGVQLAQIAPHQDVATREVGDVAQLDAQWEQWMKDAIERNELDPETMRTIMSQGRPSQSVPPNTSSGVQPLPIGSATPIDEHAASTTRPPTSASLGPQYHRLREAMDELATTSARITADTADLLGDVQTPASSTARPRTRSSTDRDRARLSTLVEELSTNNARMDAENSALQHFLSRTRTETAR
ncbi:uncharacterized protein AB675_8625 [Cyphellophora attinorum]|uniref:Uncharacterized protein n=1 Tax=Cyphellophora attinorum TaxID=1664694 RepID=A0A0N1HZM8_9EURO|nr:uncharacterized protein AB675_8625 [Phialophora attinorum]KPI44316.1 hypothetical protein AB675_8625 [Phialophora attinorum]